MSGPFREPAEATAPAKSTEVGRAAAFGVLLSGVAGALTFCVAARWDWIDAARLYVALLGALWAATAWGSAVAGFWPWQSPPKEES